MCQEKNLHVQRCEDHGGHSAVHAVVAAEVTLGGYTKDTFDHTAQAAFKKGVATSAQTTANKIVITDVGWCKLKSVLELETALIAARETTI